MKHTKKLLALLLTFVLVLTLALPATAAVNWDDFYIITAPPRDISVPHGESSTLSVEVSIPDGVEVTYQWNMSGYPIEGATASTLQLSPGDAYYPGVSNPYSIPGSYGAYYISARCRITATDSNDGQSKTLETDSAIVRVEGTPRETRCGTIMSVLNWVLMVFEFIFVYPPMMIWLFISNIF